YREVYLNETALSLIEMVVQANKEYGHKCGDFLFVKGGGRIPHHSANKALERGCKAIGIVPKRSHKIRKTYISTLIDAGVNINEIRRLVGHRDERTTFNNYCFNRQTDEMVKKQLDAALNSGLEVIKSNQEIGAENCEKPHEIKA
ncbi:MAG: tyrosine-type recombinase/integrase, partial [Lachnospiraceae bacterium]|nr:tyrosine-type recombinase/integrase [Lachnospiraceae bacterium]